MGTKDFNIFDTLIAYWRLSKIRSYINSDDVVLDIGCGHQAYLLKHLHTQIRRGIGIDYDVRNEKKDNIELIKFRFVETLPFSSGNFHKIFLLAVIEHIDIFLLPFLISELDRVLIPGGLIILTTPTPFGKPFLEFLATLRIISRAEITDHKRYYSQQDLLKVFITQKFLKLVTYKKFQFGINSLAVFQKHA